MNRHLWFFIFVALFSFRASSEVLSPPSNAIVLPSRHMSQMHNINAQVLQTLSRSSAWRSLLHADDNGVSRVRGANFFLATQGASDPYQELEMNLDLMTSENLEIAKNIQCRFPARREFFRKNLPGFENFVQKCEERDAWISKLKPEKLSLVFAAGYLNSAASSFGHTFLLIKTTGDRGDLLNYSVNFSARTGDDDGALFALKGLFGFYPGKFALLPYHQLIKDYVNFEGRDLWEYELGFSAEEIRLLIYHLFELEQGYFDYYFISQNCSQMLIELLYVVRPDSVYSQKDPLFVVPIETLKKNQNILKSEKFHPSMQSSLHRQWQVLSPRQQSYGKRVLREMVSSGGAQNLTTIKAALSEDPGLSEFKSEEWIPVIEALQLYSTMKENEGSLWKKVSFHLAKERSQITGSTDPVGVPLPSTPMRSHEPSELRWGVLQDSNLKSGSKGKNQGTQLILGWQPAYHEAVARSDGLVFGSELKILNINFSFTENDSKLNSQIEAYDLISLVNPRPPQPFEWPLSWGIRWSGDRLQDEGNLNHLFEGRLGYTMEPLGSSHNRPSLLAAFFVKSEIIATEGSSFNQPHWGWGPSLWIHYSPSNRLRFNSELYANLDRVGEVTKRYYYAKFSFGFDLKENWSLRVHRISRSFEKGENSQFQVEFVRDF